MIPEILRRPVVHIVALGVIVAAAFLIAKGPPSGDEAHRVIISGGDVLQLRAGFMRTWQREPTPEELRGLLDQHIRQEVLYREALARGYDRDDLIVRRAMQQKMEFLAASQALDEPPSEQEIKAFFSLRRERYRLPAVISFAHVFINPDQHADEERYAADLLARLRQEDPQPAAVDSWGDPIMLDSFVFEEDERQVGATFGGAFAATVLTLEPGQWQGPIASGYGLHLVKVSQREDSRLPEWSEVGARVINDMEFEAKASATEQLYQEIAQTYAIVLDGNAQKLLEPVE